MSTVAPETLAHELASTIDRPPISANLRDAADGSSDANAYAVGGRGRCTRPPSSRQSADAGVVHPSSRSM